MKANPSNCGANVAPAKKRTMPKFGMGGMAHKKPKMMYGGMANKKPNMMYGGMAKKKK